MLDAVPCNSSETCYASGVPVVLHNGHGLLVMQSNGYTKIIPGNIFQNIEIFGNTILLILERIIRLRDCIMMGVFLRIGRMN